MALESKNFKHLFLHFGGLKLEKKKATQWRVTLEWYVQCKVPTYGICSLPKSWTTIQIKKACFNHTHLEAMCWDVVNKIHLGGWGPTQLQQNKTYSHESNIKTNGKELKDAKIQKLFQNRGRLYCHHIPSMFHVSPKPQSSIPKALLQGDGILLHPVHRNVNAHLDWWKKGHEDGPWFRKNYMKSYEIIYEILYCEILWNSTQCITWFHVKSSFSTRVSSLYQQNSK